MSADQLALQIKALGLPEPEREYVFFPGRRWRADFAWPKHSLLVEYEGGIYTRGRHTRSIGYRNDLDKYNAATLAGYRVLRFCVDHVKAGTAIQAIELALEC